MTCPFDNVSIDPKFRYFDPACQYSYDPSAGAVELGTGTGTGNPAIIDSNSYAQSFQDSFVLLGATDEQPPPQMPDFGDNWRAAEAWQKAQDAKARQGQGSDEKTGKGKSKKDKNKHKFQAIDPNTVVKLSIFGVALAILITTKNPAFAEAYIRSQMTAIDPMLNNEETQNPFDAPNTI